MKNEINTKKNNRKLIKKQKKKPNSKFSWKRIQGVPGLRFSRKGIEGRQNLKKSQGKRYEEGMFFTIVLESKVF